MNNQSDFAFGFAIISADSFNIFTSKPSCKTVDPFWRIKFVFDANDHRTISVVVSDRDPTDMKRFLGKIDLTTKNLIQAGGE